MNREYNYDDDADYRRVEKSNRRRNQKSNRHKNKQNLNDIVEKMNNGYGIEDIQDDLEGEFNDEQ